MEKHLKCKIFSYFVLSPVGLESLRDLFIDSKKNQIFWWKLKVGDHLYSFLYNEID